MTERKYELYTAVFKANPYPTFAAMQTNDPIMRQLGLDGQTMIWFVTDYDAIDEILRDDKTFTRDIRAVNSNPNPQMPDLFSLLDAHMLNRDGAEHRRLRGLVSKAFTPRRIEALRGRIQEIADELLDQVQAAGEMELVEAFAFPLPITVIAELLGVPATDQDKFRTWSDAIISPALTPESIADTVTNITEFVTYLRQLLAARQAEPQDDLITALLQVKEGEDQLLETEAMSMVMLLIIAGHETTVGLLSNSVVTLLRQPEVMADLRAHPEKMPTAVEEFLRYESPVERTLARWATTDIQFHGHSFKKGDPIALIIGAANRSEAHFEAADQLDIARTPNRHMAFGKGAHYCLGAPLARLEGEIALNTILRRLPNLRWQAGHGDDSLEWQLNPTFRKPTAVYVSWDIP